MQTLTRKDPLTKKLETAKKTYFLAKVAYDLAYEAVSKENHDAWAQVDAELDGANRDEILTPLSEQIGAVEAKHHLSELRELLRQAEDLVIEAGAEVVQKLSPEKWEEVKTVFDKKNWHLGVKPKVLDLTLSLDPTR